jgi:hypothetical protein
MWGRFSIGFHGFIWISADLLSAFAVWILKFEYCSTRFLLFFWWME